MCTCSSVPACEPTKLGHSVLPFWLVGTEKGGKWLFGETEQCFVVQVTPSPLAGRPREQGEAGAQKCGSGQLRRSGRGRPTEGQLGDPIPEWWGREESFQERLCPAWWQRPEDRTSETNWQARGVDGQGVLPPSGHIWYVLF